jgi:hypothetical protein
MTESGARDQTSRNGRVVWILVVMAVTVALAMAAVVFVPRLVSPPREPFPTTPPSVATVRSQWEYPIKLPTFIPDCYGYRPGGTEVMRNPIASDGRVLVVRFSKSMTGECESTKDAKLVLAEAPALESLIGDVTTISGDRGHYARLAEPLTNGAVRLTVQWNCDELMCRLSGNLGDGGISEQELLRMAESVRQARP